MKLSKAEMWGLALIAAVCSTLGHLTALWLVPCG